MTALGTTTPQEVDGADLIAFAQATGPFCVCWDNHWPVVLCRGDRPSDLQYPILLIRDKEGKHCLTIGGLRHAPLGTIWVCTEKVTVETCPPLPQRLAGHSTEQRFEADARYLCSASCGRHVAAVDIALSFDCRDRLGATEAHHICKACLSLWRTDHSDIPLLDGSKLIQPF